MGAVDAVRGPVGVQRGGHQKVGLDPIHGERLPLGPSDGSVYSLHHINRPVCGSDPSH